MQRRTEQNQARRLVRRRTERSYRQWRSEQTGEQGRQCVFTIGLRNE
nr:MAG TPA: hypothetical protein [Caudoviricetes sp.]